MAQIGQRKCLNCNEYFDCDPRNLKRQHHCSKPECRRASKAASQAAWLAKPQNQDYFRSPVHVVRVQNWREAHPVYSHPKHKASLPLQDSLPIQTIDLIEESSVCTELPKPKDILALQDVLPIQLTDFIDESSVCTETPKPHVCTALQDIFAKPTPVLVGLIAHLFELTLQDDIAETIQRLTQMGYDIINSSHHVNLQSSAVPTATVSGT